MLSLEAINLREMCQEVEATVSKEMHFTVYGALWNTIAGSNGLLKFVSTAKDKFIQLYLSCGKSADKCCQLFCAWLEYMAYHTTSKADETEGIWRSKIEFYSGEISEDSRKVIICDILLAIQDYLTEQIAKQ